MDPVISVEFASALSRENRYSDNDNDTEVFDINVASSSDEDDRSDLETEGNAQIDRLKSVTKPIKFRNQRISGQKDKQPTYDPQTCCTCSCLLSF